MADIKFSEFSNGGEIQSTDIIVGLRSGVNTKFTSPSSGGGPFLLKVNNLSDVASPDSALINLGTGTGEPLTIVDSDFIGGIYQLPIPCPFFIIVTTDDPGNQIRLPIANVPGQSFSLGLGPEIRSINSTQSFNVADSSGINITSMSGFDSIQFVVEDTSTSSGSWQVKTKVFIVNGKIGGVTLTGSDISANFTPTNYTPFDSTITGNLEGINDYIGTHPQIVKSWNGLTDSVDVTAGSGIDITDGVISLTGTGPSSAYGFTSSQNLSTVISFTDTSTWKPLTGAFLSSSVNNFVAGNDSVGGPFFLQYVGLEAGVFEVTTAFSLSRFSSAVACGYWISASLDGSTPIDSHNQELSFCLGGTGFVPFNNAQIIPYTTQIALNPNDKIYYVLQNAGSTSPTDNDILPRQCLVTVQKIGDVGGAASGVTSLNGLVGNIDLNAGNRVKISATSSTDIQVDYLGSRSGLTAISPSTDTAIANPCPTIVSVSPTVSGLKIMLPPVLPDGSTDLLNVGDSLLIINNTFDTWFYLASQDGSILAVMLPDTKALVNLIDNSTANGTWAPLITPQFSTSVTNATSVTAWPNINYMVFAGSLTTITMIDNSFMGQGDYFEITGIGSGKFRLVPASTGSPQTISIGSSTTTAGPTGHIQSNDNNSSIKIRTQNGINFYSVGGPQGNFDVV